MNGIYDWERIEGIMMETKDSLFNFIYRMTFEKEVAQDIFQETWLKVIKNIERYNPEIPLKIWLFQIAKNLCKDYARRLKARRKSLELIRNEEIVKGEKFLPQEEERLRACLSKLPVKYREVIHLRFFEELEYEEIGKILNIPSGTVKSRVNRGLERLKKIWRERK